MPGSAAADSPVPGPSKTAPRLLCSWCDADATYHLVADVDSRDSVHAACDEHEQQWGGSTAGRSPSSTIPWSTSARSTSGRLLPAPLPRTAPSSDPGPRREPPDRQVSVPCLSLRESVSANT